MNLRIIGGALGGRRIRAPKGRATRPTREAVREAWFNALAGHLRGATVLDLFAGSGALGIEALSRGAETATFVESSPAALRILRSNLESLDLLGRAMLVRQDVFGFLKGQGSPVTLAVADPPYGRELADRLVDVWLTRPFSNILCIEHHSDEIRDRSVAWRRTYGDSTLSFFLRNGEGDPK